MDPAVLLKSIAFKQQCDDMIVSSVKCYLSDGRESQVFEVMSDRHSPSEKIVFNYDHWKKPVRFIAALTGKKGQDNCVLGLQFFDANRKKLYEYNPYGFSQSDQLVEHELRENEQLIGVYGAYGKNLGLGRRGECLRSLGFIVKSPC